MLQHVQRHVSGRIILIWDRARIHTGKKVKEYLAQHPEIQIELLPAYAPELNPEEYCHGNIICCSASFMLQRFLLDNSD